MRDEYTFRPRKKRVAVYFNDGTSAMSVECDKEHEASPHPRLVAAVKAARKEFTRVYWDRSGPPEPAPESNSGMPDGASEANPAEG